MAVTSMCQQLVVELAQTAVGSRDGLDAADKMKNPIALICTHCESGERPILFVAFTPSDVSVR